jgi:starch synthase (maltosyl-transferring)
VIERLEPLVDNGRYFAKRVRGEALAIRADIFADGHDIIRAVARVRHNPFAPGARASRWVEHGMSPLGNDAWHALVALEQEGWLEFAVTAWIDAFATWRDGLRKKHDAGVGVASELLEGAAIVDAAARRVRGAPAKLLSAVAQRLGGDGSQDERVAMALDAAVLDAMQAADNRPDAVESAAGRVRVERVRARTGAWYEMFPRSYTPDATRSATFAEAAERLPAIAAMGFDVLYLPPIHPIGRTHRKGRNNALAAGAGDPGSPWAIGGAEGGHTAIEPGLGGFDDFEAFRRRWASSSRSIWPTSARPITRGSASIPNGSDIVPTDRSSTPRIRPRSIRTSIPSTSRATHGRPSGTRCGTSSSSGWNAACASSGSTTRTPRASASGSGPLPTSRPGTPT